MNLPNFLIAGERRCGTTMLAEILRGHPDIFLWERYDKRWFIEDEVKTPDLDQLEKDWEETHDIADYLSLFDIPEARGKKAIGEKSADYLYWWQAHARIKRFLPNVRLIVILRNPVNRAWSHYWNEVAKGRESLTFEEAMDREPERIARSLYERYNFSYLDRGRYASNLKRLFSTFDPERVKIITLEDMIDNREGTAREVFSFLGVEKDAPLPAPERKNPNWGMEPRPWIKGVPMKTIAKTYRKIVKKVSKPFFQNLDARRAFLVRMCTPFYVPARSLRMKPETRTRLTEHFSDEIHALEELLGRKFNVWKE